MEKETMKKIISKLSDQHKILTKQWKDIDAEKSPALKSLKDRIEGEMNGINMAFTIMSMEVDLVKRKPTLSTPATTYRERSTETEASSVGMQPAAPMQSF